MSLPTIEGELHEDGNHIGTLLGGDPRWLKKPEVGTVVDTAYDDTSTNAVSNAAFSATIQASHEPVQVGESISAAIAKVVARAGKGKVVLAPGVHEKTGQLDIPPGVMLVSEAPLAASVKQMDATANMMRTSGDNPGVRGILIDGNSLVTSGLITVGGGTDGAVIEDNKFINAANGTIHGVICAETFNLKVRRNTFDGVNTPFHCYTALKTAWIEDNELFDWWSRGIYIIGIDGTKFSSDVWVSRNMVHPPNSSSGPGIPRQPITISASAGNAYHERIHFIANDVTGLYLDHDGGTGTGTADQLSFTRCDDSEMIENFSRGGGDMGATFEHCTNSRAINNHLYHSSSKGLFLGSSTAAGTSSNLYAAGNVLNNNYLDQSGSSVAAGGIHANIQAQRIDGLQIVGGNQGSDCEYGVEIDECTGVVEHGNEWNGSVAPLYLRNVSFKETNGFVERFNTRDILPVAAKLGTKMWQNVHRRESLNPSGSCYAHTVESIPITGSHSMQSIITQSDRARYFGLTENVPSGFGSMSHVALLNSNGLISVTPNGTAETLSELAVTVATYSNTDVITFLVVDGVVSLQKNHETIHVYTVTATAPLYGYVFFGSGTGTFDARVEEVEIDGVPVTWDQDLTLTKDVVIEYISDDTLNKPEVKTVTGAYTTTSSDYSKTLIVDDNVTLHDINTSDVGKSVDIYNASSDAISVEGTGFSASVNPSDTLTLKRLTDTVTSAIFPKPLNPRSYINRDEWGWDDTPGADNFAAFSACIDALREVTIPDIEVFLGSRYFSPFDANGFHFEVRGINKSKSKLTALPGGVSNTLIYTAGANRTVSVSNLTIDGNKDNTTTGTETTSSTVFLNGFPEGCEFNNVDVINSYFNGIYATSVVGTPATLKMTDVNLLNNGTQGVKTGNSTIPEYTRVKAEDNGNHGIHVLTPITGKLVECEAHRNGVVSTNGHGIVITKTSKNLRVIGGRTSYNGSGGLTFGDPGTVADGSHEGFTIDGHVAHHNVLNGISIDPADGLVPPNALTYSLEGAIITNCRSHDNQNNGLFVNSGRGLEISKNVFKDNGVAGFIIANGGDSNIFNNTITGNTTWGYLNTTTGQITNQTSNRFYNNLIDTHPTAKAGHGSRSPGVVTYVDSDITLISSGIDAFGYGTVGDTFVVENTSHKSIDVDVAFGGTLTGDTSVPAGGRSTFTLTAIGAPSTNYATWDGAITSDAPRSMEFSYLREVDDSINPEITLALDANPALKRIRVDGHYPETAYTDDSQLGEAVYSVSQSVVGSPDGYSSINVGTRSLSLTHKDKVIKAGMWGIVADGSDEQVKMQACADYASANSTTSNRITLIIETGDIGVANIEIAGSVNVWMLNGASFNLLRNIGTFDATKPVVTIGSVDSQSSGADHRNLSVVGQYYTGVAADGVIGLRVQNFDRSDISFGSVLYFTSCVELAGVGDNNYFGYNRLRGGSIRAGRYLVTFYSRHGADTPSTNNGWVNENHWLKPQLSATSTWNKEGSIWGFRFKAEDGAYNGANSNSVTSGSVEIGASASVFTYTPGETYGLNQHVCAEGREYKVLVAGPLPALPTHTSGTVNNLEYVGDYRRTAILFDGAGQYTTFHSMRWEGGYGEYVKAIQSGATPSALTGDRTTVEINTKLATIRAPNDSGQDMDLSPPGQARLQKGIIKFASELVTPHRLEYKNLEESFIYSSSANKWHSSRMPFMTYNNTNIIVRDYDGTKVSSNTAVQPNFHKSFIDFPSIYGQAGIILDITNHRHFKYYMLQTQILTSVRLYCLALDENFDNIAQTTVADSSIYVNLDGVPPTAVQYQAVYVNLNNETPVAYVGVRPQATTVKYLALVAAGRCSKFAVEAYSHSTSQNNLPIKVVNPHPNINIDDTSNRRSEGTPDQGYFKRQGEVIQHITNGDSWTVTEAGIGAPAWATSESVKDEELKVNAGNCYAAVGAGTTGATAPTHTSGTVNDGSVDWEWLAPTPTIVLNT